MVCAATLFATSCVKDDVYGIPSVSNINNTAAYTADEDVTVTATVESMQEVRSVKLYYRAGAGDYTSVAMTRQGDSNTYTAVIPHQPLDTEVSYYIEVETESGTVRSDVVTFVVGAIPVDYSGLVLNELNGNDKFIELYNKGSEKIPLAGVYIEKDGKNVWEAEGITLEAGAYLLLYSEDVIATDHPEYEGSGLVFASGLSAKKAVRVQLFTPTGLSIDDFNLVDYTTPASASYSRCPDGTGPWTYADATPKATNAQSTEMVGGLATPEIGIVPGGDKPSGDQPGGDEPGGDQPGGDEPGGDEPGADEPGIDDPSSDVPVEPVEPSESPVVLNEVDGNIKYIELYNTGSESVSLTGYTLWKNDEMGSAIWTGEEGITIEANDYVVLYSNKATGITVDAEYIFDGGLSPKKSVKIELRDLEGNTVDVFARGPEPWDTSVSENPDCSFSRVENGTGDWFYAAPTPGAANGEKVADIVD